MDSWQLRKTTAVARIGRAENTSWRWRLEGLELAHTIVDAILDKKGSDILLLDIRHKSIIADYFLICNGDNVRQMKAMVEAIVEDTSDTTGIRPTGTEGEAESGWMLLDFEDIIVHVFDPEKRTYYNLEELWHDGHIVLRMQ